MIFGSIFCDLTLLLTMKIVKKQVVKKVFYNILETYSKQNLKNGGV